MRKTNMKSLDKNGSRALSMNDDLLQLFLTFLIIAALSVRSYKTLNS